MAKIEEIYAESESARLREDLENIIITQDAAKEPETKTGKQENYTNKELEWMVEENQRKKKQNNIVITRLKSAGGAKAKTAKD